MVKKKDVVLQKLNTEQQSNVEGNRTTLRTFFLCIVATVFVQLAFIPFLNVLRNQTCSLITDEWRFFNSVCPRQASPGRAVTERAQSKAALFLEDPFPLKPWKEPGELVARPEESERSSPTTVKEALAALSAARSFREKGHIEKARVIIEHALALAPVHPDILTEYGVVHEQQDNIIEADYCYAKALAYDPAHQGAIERRRFTLPVVSMKDRKMLEKIRSILDEFNELSHSPSLRRAMRESYFLHVYHTVAIEGNTLSLGQTRSILETEMAVEGKSIREHNEVLGMDSALRFLNRTLLSSSDLSLDDILEMHRRVVGHSQPEIAGRLRDTQVHVGRFTPVAPEYVPYQMQEFVDWLNSQELDDMDPVEKAAIAHYKLVLIHPFVDGNGRTARLLLNLILMRSGFPPVILPVESRAKYYSVLGTANLGDLRPFIRYVAQHTENTLQSYISAATTCGSNCKTTQLGNENMATVLEP
ncbi:unnamed protein product [Auanema sp. JU1783]|nr:unnamed protein product [Auanema sp. JU1783]